MKKKYLLIIIILNLLFFSTHAAQQLKIQLSGVPEDIKKNIEARIDIKKKELSPALSSQEIYRFYHSSLLVIQNAIAPFGYFSPVIHSQVIYQHPVWILHYVIALGQPVRISGLHIQLSGPGQDNKKINQAIEKIPLHIGKIFNAPEYEKTKTQLLIETNNQGYIKAHYLKSVVFIDTKKLTADITWHLNTEQQYYFGELNFNKTPYSPYFLQRFNPFAQDDVFSSQKLLAYQRALNDSRYFDQAIVIPDLEQINHYHVPLRASVTAPKARLYTFGVGYGTFTGARVSAGLNWRRLNDSGHAFDTQLKASSVFSGLALKYFIPGKDPLTEEYMFGLNTQKFMPKNGESRSGTFTFGYNKTLKHWKINSSLNYLLERYAIDDNPHHVSQLLYPKLDISYLKTDDVTNPAYGRLLQFILQGASQHLYSKTDFFQAEAKGMWLTSPASFAQIILRGDVGYTVVKDLTFFPLSMQFFSGGITSLRGYPNNSIGPGKYLATSSIEYRNHLRGNWSGALFYDIGAASNHFGKPLNQGVGVGVIYKSIMGPIKVYLARPLNRRGHRYQIEFSIGPEF